MCKRGLYLDNGNCVKNTNCPYKFYYKANIDKNAYSTEKVCLRKDEMCPSSLPFYYTSTNECVQSCPLDLLLYQGCKISNYYYGISYFILSIKINFIQGLLSTLGRSFSFYAFNNIYLKVSILDIPCICNVYNNYRNLRSLDSEENKENKLPSSYQSLIDDNLTQIETVNNFEGSDINLGECENKLREYYNISDDVDLTIIKIDYKRNDSKISQVQYEIFNPKNRSEKLDLSICEKEKIKVTNPVDISAFKLGDIIEASNDNFQFSDISETLYNDMCYSFLSENGAYVLLQDRIVDYNYEEQYCQKGCSIQDINVTSSTATCLCPPNEGFGNINVEKIYNNIYNKDTENSDNDSSEEKYNTQKYSYTNIKAFKCIKNMFSSEFVKNYILIIFTLLLISYLVLIIKCLISYKKFKNDYKDSIIKCNPPKSKDDAQSEEKLEKKTEEKEKKKEKKKKKKDKIQKIKSDNVVIDSKDILKKTNLNEKKSKENTDNDTKSLEEAKNESFLEMFLYSLKKREIIFSFFNKINNSVILKVILLILSFINYFAVNTFFFSEKNVHQIYLDKDAYNFSYQIKYIMASLLISYVFLSIAKYFYNIGRTFCIIPNRIHLMISFIVSGIIFIFYWLYIGSVTSLYINIKKHLIINIIL